MTVLTPGHNLKDLDVMNNLGFSVARTTVSHELMGINVMNNSGM